MKELVDEQFKLGEYYLHVIDLPDSALIVYARIIQHRDVLSTKLDSLVQKVTAVDSLLQSKTVKASASDSLLTAASVQTNDFLYVNVADSIKVSQPDSTHIKIADTVTKPDSALTITAKTITQSDSSEVKTTAIAAMPDSLDTLKQDLLAKVKQTGSDLKEYDTEYVPKALFNQIWIFQYSIQDTTRMQALFHTLQNRYPLSSYTHAAEMLVQGENPELTTSMDMQLEADFEQATALYGSQPDSALVLLKKLAVTTHPVWQDKAVFTLGYLYWFDKQDSLLAKPYLDSLLVKDANSDYSTFIHQFYDGKNFIFTTELASIRQVEMQDSMRIADLANKAKLKREVWRELTQQLNKHNLMEGPAPAPVSVQPEKPAAPDEEKDALKKQEMAPAAKSQDITSTDKPAEPAPSEKKE
jgi:hypothetical protein